MRVLVITPWFPSAAAPGSGIFNLRDVEMLAAEHEIHVLHLLAPRLHEDGEASEQVLASGVVVHRIPYDLRHPKQLVAARGRIRTMLEDADLVHTMAFPALFPTKLAKPKVPWVHTEHWSGLVNPAPTLHARLGAVYLRRDLAKPDEVVAVSQDFAEVLNAYRDTACTVIGNHVRIAEGERPEHSDPHRVRLVGVAGLVRWKGPLQAVAATAELCERGVDATLDWAGTGPLETDVRSLARQLGIETRVRLRGHLSPGDLSELLLGTDMFLLPTEAETFGVAIAEALGHGLPVVTSGHGGHESFLPPQASRLVADRSGSALADAVINLWNDPNRWSASRIIEYAREKFGNEARRGAYQRVYARAAQKSRFTQR